MSGIEFKPEWAGKHLHELPDGASGYKSRPAEQALNEMADGGVVITEAEDFMRAIPQTFSFPQVCNPLDYLKVKNQQQKGSCQGHSLAGVGEMNFWVATGGDIERFSGDATYVLSQEKDGIKGDRGSTPTAGAWVAQNIGLVPESAYGPTVKTYNELKPVTDAHRQAAADYKMSSIVRLKSYDQMYQFLGAGLGAIQVCSLWKQHFMAKYVTTFFGEAHNSRHAGGHAYLCNGYNKNGDLLCTNSWGHGSNTHDEGGFLTSRNFWEELFSDKMSFVLGYSNMKTSKSQPPGPRTIPVKASDWV